MLNTGKGRGETGLLATLQKYGGEVPEANTSRAIVALSGMPKSGKTHFGLSAPDPIVIYNLDEGIREIVGKFVSKSIYSIPLEVERGKEDWERFETSFAEMVQCPDIRTIVVDTESELVELARMAEWGRTTAKQHHHGKVNSKYRQVMRLAANSHVNLILLRQMRKVYVTVGVGEKAEKVWSGAWEPVGMTKIDYMVHVVGELRRNRSAGEFELEIQNCRQVPELDQVVLRGGSVDFATLGVLLGLDIP